jgi:hypothetical protein
MAPATENLSLILEHSNISDCDDGDDNVTADHDNGKYS